MALFTCVALRLNNFLLFLKSKSDSNRLSPLIPSSTANRSSHKTAAVLPGAEFLSVVDRLRDELYDAIGAENGFFEVNLLRPRVVQADTMTFDAFLLLGLLTR